MGVGLTGSHPLVLGPACLFVPLAGYHFKSQDLVLGEGDKVADQHAN